MKEIKSVLQAYPNRDREYLLPLLQDIQKAVGYLPEEAITAVAAHLRIPTSKVYAVATFYDQFRFTPETPYCIKICNGTACHMEGSDFLFEELRNLLEVNERNESKNRLFSLEQVQCLGACGNAPVARINEDFYTHVSLGKMMDLITAIREKEEKQ